MAKIAVLIGEGFEDVEYTEPAKAFKEAGHELIHIGKKKGTVEGKQGEARVRIDVPAVRADPAEYDALFIPGGHSPDNLRTDENVLEIVRFFVEEGLPTLVICHGPQLLITAKVAEGKKMTGYKSIRVDMENAGIAFEDGPVVEDENLVSSRNPDDIPQFIDASLRKIAETVREDAVGESAMA